MRGDDVSPDEMRIHRSFDDHTVEAILAGRTPDGRDDLEPLAALAEGLRTAYRGGPRPQMREQLAGFVEAPLTAKDDLPVTAESDAAAPVLAAQTAALSTWRDHTRRKVATMLSSISAFVATVAGKAVLGTAVAAASVGGLHAADVVDVPGLPGGNGSAAVEEHQPDVGSQNDPSVQNGPGEEGREDGFTSTVVDDATDSESPGIDDPSTVVEDAPDYGVTKAEENSDADDSIPDDPTSNADPGTDASTTSSAPEDVPSSGEEGQDTGEGAQENNPGSDVREDSTP